MRLYKFLKIFLLSSLLLIIPNCFVFANNLTHSDIGIGWHEYGGFGVSKETWKNVRNKTITLHFTSEIEIPSSYYVVNNAVDKNYFDANLLDSDGNVIGNMNFHGYVPNTWVGKKFSSISVKFNDIDFNEQDFANERFPYFYLGISTNGDFMFGGFLDLGRTSFDVVDHTSPPIEIPSLPTAPDVPDNVPDIDFDINNNTNLDISDILNNIVEGIKQFFKNLLQYGMTILLTAISVASLFWFTIWLWKKVKIWLSSV